MCILMSDEIKNAIYHELDSARDSVQIITAYCKVNTLQTLDAHVSSVVGQKRILVRFRLDDLISGSTDFSILDFCRQHGWRTYIRFDLHAKTYIVDDKRGIIGSANATNNGLLLGSAGNLEIATLTEMSVGDVNKINRLFNEAIEVDDALYDELKRQYQSIEILPRGTLKKWQCNITRLFNPSINILFSCDFPETDHVTLDNLIAFLNLPTNTSYEQAKEAFLWCRGYRWIVQTVKENDDCMFFGALTQSLHNALITDPKPYRRDVKIILSNMLIWISEIGCGDLVIDRPNHSQRIRTV